MTELEKIQYARSFIDQLADGINPLDGTPIPAGEVAAQPRMAKCFAYVSDVLGRVITEGEGKKPRVKKQRFALSPQQRAALTGRGMPMTVTDISRHLNSLIDPETTKKLSTTPINRWLMEVGLLREVAGVDGKRRKMITDAGMEAGLFREERTGQMGSYFVILLNANAQQLVYDNLEAIIDLRYPEDESQNAKATQGGRS